MARMDTTLPGRVVDVTVRAGVEPTHFVVARDTGVSRRSVTRHRVTATLDALPGTLVAWTTRRRPRLAAGDVVDVTLDPSITPPLITGLAAPGASRLRTLDLRAHGEWLTPAPDAATLAALGITTGTGAARISTGTGTSAGRTGRVLAVALVTAALLLVTGLIVWARPDTPTAQAGPPDPTEPAATSPTTTGPTAPTQPTSTGPTRLRHHQPGHGQQQLATTPPANSLPTTLPTETMPTSSPLPDVTRLSVTSATRILTSAGYRVDVPHGAVGTERVTSTNPAPGTLVEPGSLVRLILATTTPTGPTDSTPPTPTLDPTVTTAPSAAPSSTP